MPELTPGTSMWWLDRLSKQLDLRLTDIQRYNDYYSGKHNPAFGDTRWRSAFGNRFQGFADNFTELVVDSVEERLNVEGFRIQDQAGDQDAWRIWQENNLDAESQIAHTEALVKSKSYALVWGNGDRADITIEDPLQMVVAHAAGNRRMKRAALKRWIDDSGLLFATLYFPDRIEKYKSDKAVDPLIFTQMETQVNWVKREVSNETWPLRNPLGEVPIVPFINKPRLDGSGESEIHSVIPIQDAVNKLVADLLIAAEYGAFRQRWATGIEIPRDPETNQPIEPFKSAIDRLWTVEDNEARFGEFGQTDLAPYVQSIEMLIQHIASITRTPPHYFLASMGNFPSGEALKSAETGLVSKSRRKMRHFGESWESVMRLAFRVLDDPRGKVIDSETIWRNPESRSDAELTDSLVKLQALGVPWEQLMEDRGYTPQQIARMEQMRMKEALTVASAFNPFQRTDAGEPAQPQTA